MLMPLPAQEQLINNRTNITHPRSNSHLRTILTIGKSRADKFDTIFKGLKCLKYLEICILSNSGIARNNSTPT
jgi:hypothetical protein